MIQKRYQYWGAKGKTWTPWYNVSEDDSKFKELSKNKWEMKGSLRAEYRIIK